MRLSPMLAVYDVAHYLPLFCAGRGFPFTEDETRRHLSYLTGTFRERIICQTPLYLHFISWYFSHKTFIKKNDVPSLTFIHYYPKSRSAGCGISTHDLSTTLQKFEGKYSLQARGINLPRNIVTGLKTSSRSFISFINLSKEGIA